MRYLLVIAAGGFRTGSLRTNVENNKIELDRLSVIRRLAEALDVTLADLVAEPTLLDWTSDSGVRTVPALRAALMDYGQITPDLPSPARPTSRRDLDALQRDVGEVFDAYQASRYGYVTGRAPLVLADAFARPSRRPTMRNRSAHTRCSRWPTRRRCPC